MPTQVRFVYRRIRATVTSPWYDGLKPSGLWLPVVLKAANEIAKMVVKYHSTTDYRWTRALAKNLTFAAGFAAAANRPCEVYDREGDQDGTLYVEWR